MPTPSKDAQSPEPGVSHPKSEWAAQSGNPGRSVFANYRADAPQSTPSPIVPRPDPGTAGLDFGVPLQSSINSALARSVVYRFLAQAYEDPTEDGWARLVGLDCRQMLGPAVRTLVAAGSELAEAAAALQSELRTESFDVFLMAYLAAFGHAARGRCPLNEIEYGDIKADPLFQPHRLADLAAFYRAFGLEVATDADERHDHICLELEFMCVLVAKEAYALEHQLDPEELSICRDAQKRFLREHLARWIPAFARRLARMTGDTPLGALANFTRCFVEAECAGYGIAPGSEDLLLRPVDEAAESMCNSCGLTHPPAGAVPPGLATI